ncbi:MAG TPA: Dyp-type peroxidase [Microthrixaceae bacterium]|nr:Dyp-type peroxidase [Microthrixaceae bacterium]
MTTNVQAQSVTPQPGIFALGSRYQYLLEFDVSEERPASEVVAALAELRESNVTGGGVNMVVGFSSKLWARLNSLTQPNGARSFQRVEGLDGMIAPATQHDIWVWVHGAGTDVVFDTASIVASTISRVATIAEDLHCFVYHDSRDLTGFIDGTANPTPMEAPSIACVPSGQPGAGGSHVIAQKWVHNLVPFNELDVAEQEKVIGRSKADSVAIPKPSRPADAHITLAEIRDENGEEREIFRRSVPWGTPDQHGLYFIGFSAEQDRFDEMLAQMYGTDGRTIRDRLLDFTTAVSGSYYFAPSLEDLRRLGVATAGS